MPPHPGRVGRPSIASLALLTITLASTRARAGEPAPSEPATDDSAPAEPAPLATAGGSAIAETPASAEPPATTPAPTAPPTDPPAAAPTKRRKLPRLPAGFAIDLTAGTSFPVAVSVAPVIEFPYRLLLHLELGWLPGPYVDAINGVVVAVGGYDANSAQIIRDAIKNSLVFRTSVGWRPFKRRGFEFRGGYTLASLGGGLTPAQGIELATGESLERTGERAIPLSATLHSFHIEVGWRFVVRERLVIRTMLGYLQTVASESRLDVDRATLRPIAATAVDRAEVALDDYLRDLFTTYVKAPVISLHLGYRF